MKEIIETNKEKYELIDEIEKVNECLINCVDNLIEIGFRLEDIKNNKSYELIGYPSFDDFISIEFKLGLTSVKNYISVAKKFGNERSLKLQENHSLSQLVELLLVSEDIDSSALTTKEIKSEKIISQFIDYKKELLNCAVNYLKEHKEELHKKYPLIKYFYKVYREDGILYIDRIGSYVNLLTIKFSVGYYCFNYNKIIYDLSLENFKKIFEEELTKAFTKLSKELLEEKEEQDKRKQEKIDALPENEPGISFEEKIERKEKRLKEEEIFSLEKELNKNKNYYFGYTAYYYSTSILTFEIFMLFNKVSLENYPLLYKPKIDSEEEFVGLINGLTHLRFFNNRIEQYDLTNKEFKTILTLDEINLLFSTLIYKFQTIDNSLFSTTQENKTVYIEDLRCLVKNLNDKNNKVFYDTNLKQ